MMLWLFTALIFSGIVLICANIQVNPRSRVIQKRLTEIAPESPLNRTALARAISHLVAPLIVVNRRIHLDPSRGLVNDWLLAGKVPLTTSEFFVLKELGALGGIWLYLALTDFKITSPFWLILSGLAGFMLPGLWLRHKAAARRFAIASDLPELVDLLALSVDAGSDFMSAMNRVVREYRPCHLKDELALVLQEIRLGKRRREAFRAFGQRVKMPEIASFVRTIVHADRMGTGMAQALRIMSEDTRLRRYHQAERFAQRAPLKLLFPLILIMMSVLLIVAGPVMLQFMRGDMFPKF